MIKEHCFTEEWLNQFKKQKDHKRIDKIILEKMIYALHLLECLKLNNFNFVFKGGTSLVLLLEEANRFSIDIDIISQNTKDSIEEILNNVIKTSRFTKWDLDENRSYKPDIPKAHYKFSFDSIYMSSGTILLDILIEDSIYPELTEIPISTKWIEIDDICLVKVPSVDSITGDKLTAFAPNTIGIPFFKGKDNQSFSMEICKQLFDLSKLFERIENMETVAASFKAFAEREIIYRKHENPDSTLTPEIVLKDTIDTCLIITKQGKGSDDEIKKFADLQRGIKAFGNGYLMSGNFRIDDAIQASSRIAYLATKLLYHDLSPINYFDNKGIDELFIQNSEWNFLNRLKRQPDKSSFYYWYRALEIMDNNISNG